MRLGLSTYACAWRRRPEGGEAWTLEQVMQNAAALGCEVVQLCDVPEIEDPSPERLSSLRAEADRLGLAIEVGTKGVEPDHLARLASTADALGAVTARSMLSSPRHTPSLTEAESRLREIIPDFERAGVTLGLETYEQFATADLVRCVERVGSPYLGICLDPGNTVARLEHPAEVVRMTAAHVVNLHVKDFAFSRKEGAIGFTFAGAPLGTGLLDYPSMCAELERHGKDVTHVIEHWLTRQETPERTRRVEERWVADSVDYLRRHEQANTRDETVKETRPC